MQMDFFADSVTKVESSHYSNAKESKRVHNHKNKLGRKRRTL